MPVPDTSQVSVGTSATAILSHVAGDGYPQRYRITNSGAATVFVGGSGVTTGTGHALPAGASMDWEVRSTNENLFGVVAAGTETVTTIRVL